MKCYLKFTTGPLLWFFLSIIYLIIIMDHAANSSSNEILEMGDIIEFTLASGPHWAIYLGHGFFAHSVKDEDSDKNVVELFELNGLIPFQRNNSKDSIFRSPRSPEEIVLIALSETGKTTSKSNRDFVDYCRYSSNIMRWGLLILFAVFGVLMSCEHTRGKVHYFMPVVKTVAFVLVSVILSQLLLICLLAPKCGCCFMYVEHKQRKVQEVFTVDLAKKEMCSESVPISDDDEDPEMSIEEPDQVIFTKLKFKKVDVSNDGQ